MTESYNNERKWSAFSLLACDHCGSLCKRGVSLPCCWAVQSCRLCAVRKVTSIHKCWNCHQTTSTEDIEVDIVARQGVEQVQTNGELEVSVRSQLEDRVRRRRGPAGVDRKVEDKNRGYVSDTQADKERLTLAKKRFRNPVGADPNCNLSFHGSRSRRLVSKKRRPEEELHFLKINNGRLVPVERFINPNNKESLKRNIVIDSDDQCVDLDEIPNVMKEVFITQLQNRYGDKYGNKEHMELKRFVSHYVEGFHETKDFYKFYNETISRVRLKEMLDLEKLMAEFSKHYGDVQPVYCNRCGESHRF